MLNGSGSDCLGEVLQDVGQNSKLFNRCLCHGYLENYAAMWTIWRMICEQPILPTIPTHGELSDRSGRYYDYYGYYFPYGALINPPTGKIENIYWTNLFHTAQRQRFSLKHKHVCLSVHSFVIKTPSIFILHPSSLILHLSSFISHPLYPSSLILRLSSFIFHPSFRNF